MARHALGPATLAVVQALEGAWRDPERDPDGSWLVGCSGGPDSLALALGAYEACRRAGALSRLGAVVVDHDLQQGSAAVAATARDRLLAIGYPSEAVRVVRVVVDPEQARELGIEAAARNARYAAFEQVAAEAPVETEVLLGHTRDDQAETVLLGIVRGSGMRSLAGIAPRRGPYVRPLLDLARADLRACCAENDLAWWEDPANADERYARVRVRHRVLPVLAESFGGDGAVSAALARTAALARVDADFLDALAEAAEEDAVVPATERAGDELDCTELAFLPEALRTRVVRRWLVGHGSREPGAVHVAAVCALVTHWHGQKGVDVPGLRVVREEGHLRATGAPRDGDRGPA
ncbi:tRNA(Ile)-lysidine synthase [Raineyella antarctica]|uniref:tRNA(Ile)-lysidine synthase n=1 Tax=Raineyella antarctica TaxID=1577474 RepID=A0A1G6IIY6_9ACTN|nr:tRNA lysidine(34) synthetase TilS [Raineyella antarctica]SDC06487.1 tRNA(Ile)-lysidine synthase [Raineyella antarctica]